MKVVFRLLGLCALTAASLSCSDVSFKSQKNNTGGSGCTGANCPTGGSTYSWYQSGYGTCNKPCGGGSQVQTVECRRSSDNVTVADTFCTGTKPESVKSCNVQACTTAYTWNIGPYGECSKLCDGGVRTRTVLCQSQFGATVADSNCPTPKPITSEVCNTNICGGTSYSWNVTPGICSKECGGGIATDIVVCKKNDGTIVADSFCSATAKPPTNRTCNTQTCPQNYTYAWESGAWSVCSKSCGDGIQTRTVACKRSDGVYVSEAYCNAGTKPSTQQTCKIMNCTGGRSVTTTAYVSPASNSVDVIVIVDDSGSMKKDQAKLATRMSGLLADLDAANVDYQVCLTTTDIGHYKGSPIKWQGLNTFIMTKSSPNKSSVFTTTIDSLGAEWSSDEQPIKATYLMIRDFASSGCIRPEATLTTIVVTDEDERSVGGNQSLSATQYQPLTTENYPDTLINFVKSKYNTSTFTKPFIWNSIIVKPGDAVCEAIQDDQGSVSFAGVIHAQLSTKTGGHIGSICDEDYSQNLKYIKDRVVNNLPGLKLECIPTNTPVVTFDQQVVTSISLVGDELKFNPAIPEGIRVTAQYTCAN